MTATRIRTRPLGHSTIDATEIGLGLWAMGGGWGTVDDQNSLDAIEVALERGQLFAFPGRGTRALVRLRRFIPSVVWRQIDAMEAGSARPTLLPPPSR